MAMTINPLAPPNLSAIQPGDLIDEKEAAAILAVAVTTLRNWRALKQGPRYKKLGARMVRYSRAELAAFINGGHAA
jgi:predicted DNA-binding transcriptional regulator AlpA